MRVDVVATSHRLRSVAVVLAAVLVGTLGVVIQPEAAQSFGTIDGLGQTSEHERITRRALACTVETQFTSNSLSDCFEPNSIAILAGQGGNVGAVGDPDLTETFVHQAHCDNADYLDASYLPAGSAPYPRSRAQASQTLLECIAHLRHRFNEGVSWGNTLVTPTMGIENAGVGCHGFTVTRSKCEAIRGFGRMLHGVQDFYSHSNYADRSDSTRRIGIDNPPGLHLAAPAPFLNMLRPLVEASALPRDLTTDCFGLWIFGNPCSQRVSHEAINKDEGDISAFPLGPIENARTPRGMVELNFLLAVSGAIIETKSQWASFRNRLTTLYGTERGRMIACVMTHDIPDICSNVDNPGAGILYKDTDSRHQLVEHFEMDGDMYGLILDNHVGRAMQAAREMARSEHPDERNPDFHVVVYAHSRDLDVADQIVARVSEPTQRWDTIRNTDPLLGPLVPPAYADYQCRVEAALPGNYPYAQPFEFTSKRGFFCEHLG